MKLSLEYIHGHVIQGGGHLSLLLINGKESHHLPVSRDYGYMEVDVRFWLENDY